MAKKLKDFHQSGIDALVQARDQLKRYLTEIQSDQEPDPFTPPDNASVILARKRKKQWSDWMAGIDAESKKVRTALADESRSAAELEALAERLRLLQIKRKGVWSLINGETELIAELERKALLIGQQLETIAADLAVAEAELADVTAISERNSAWTDAIALILTDDPEAPLDLAWLKTIKADAEATLNDAQGLFKMAQARVEADIPEPLRLRALERLGNVWALEKDAMAALTDMEDKSDAKNKAEQGISGAIHEKITIYDNARAALEALIINAKSTYETARAMLRAIVESKAVSGARQQRVNELVTTALAVTPAEEIVFAKEQTRNDKRREVDEKQQQLLAAEAIVRADAPDISEEDLANAAAVKPIREALGDDSSGLLKELKEAEDALGFDVLLELREEEQELEQAVRSYEQSRLAFLKEHPEADPETDPDPAIAGPRDDRDAQQALVDVKLSMFKETAWYQLEAMEVALPDRVWNNFKQVHAAEMMLQQLSNLPDDLTVYKTDLDNAEDGLVTALEADGASDLGFAGLAEDIAGLSLRLRWFAEQREAWLFDAARGID